LPNMSQFLIPRSFLDEVISQLYETHYE